ncbi:uncharacterized protein CELE_W08E12.9 [Caenorhabditis elegans]|uniref:Uncharacterized protein n=1 Tax=Caenorhabditis elegans TaxID=6239 RepID=Q9N5A9_CAEEL|nr:Uncharacterized protein CELE_W08E12.9 [Caenorhabditis elegans]CCD74017.2 Uncharacterized protein CELE_W08E12.9 [Caenorhabditis elegans]|eukprot:NP_500317.2 Uncharacterized protein CELE_W08E12.9 [Caenorhabditis elegans]
MTTRFFLLILLFLGSCAPALGCYGPLCTNIIFSRPCIRPFCVPVCNTVTCYRKYLYLPPPPPPPIIIRTVQRSCCTVTNFSCCRTFFGRKK